MDKFKAGDWVVARNGKGPVYMVNGVVEFDLLGHKTRYYDFDNGSVNIHKRAKSGLHNVEQAERGYKLVKD